MSACMSGIAVAVAVAVAVAQEAEARGLCRGSHVN